MTRITGAWIDRPSSQQVCAILQEAGHQVYFVGGCVRNALLGLPVTDVDMATSALPEQTMALAAAAGIKAVPTGIEHGTVTLVTGRRAFEVTTFRKDASTDGRRAVVKFADNIHDDAARRDFTLNALYALPDGTLADPLGGLQDLQDRRIVFIGDADARIREDYLRILRFFRMYALYGDPKRGPDQDALSAISRNLDGLARLSKERITHELCLLLDAPDPSVALAAMEQTGALAAALPEASALLVPALVAAEMQLGVDPDWLRRLAALGAANVAQDLRLTRADGRQLELIEKAQKTNETPAQLAQRFGKPAAISAVLIGAARSGGNLPDDLESKIERGSSAEFPVSTQDVELRGFKGSDLGAALREMKERWITSDMQLSRAQLLSDFARSR